MRPSNYTTTCSNTSNEEELQTRAEYEIAARKMIISDTYELAAKINGSSLDPIQKRMLIKDSIAILLNAIR